MHFATDTTAVFFFFFFLGGGGGGGKTDLVRHGIFSSGIKMEGWAGQTDVQCETKIPRHYLLTGYKIKTLLHFLYLSTLVHIQNFTEIHQ